MMENNNSSSTGMGLTTALFITFLILKLCKVITWSWLWVTSPLWIGLLIGIIIIVFFNNSQIWQTINKDNNCLRSIINLVLLFFVYIKIFVSLHFKFYLT